MCIRDRTLGARTARTASGVQTEAASTQSDAEAAEDTGDMAQTTESATAGQTLEAEDSAEYADDLPQQADAQQQTDEDPLSCCLLYTSGAGLSDGGPAEHGRGRRGPCLLYTSRCV